MRTLLEVTDLLRGACRRRSKFHGHAAKRKATTAGTARCFSRGRLGLEPLEERRLLSAVSGEVSIPLYLPPQHHLWSPGGYLSAPVAGDAQDIAVNYLASHAADLGVSAADIQSFAVTDSYRSPEIGLTHVYLCEQYNGVQIVNARINVDVSDDGRVLNADGGFVSLPMANVVPAIAGSVASISFSSNEAREIAIRTLDTDQVAIATSALSAQDQPAASTGDVALAGGTSASSASEATAWEDVGDAKLVYVATADGLALTWDMVLQASDHSHCYDVNVDSAKGSVLGANDWVDHATYNVFPLPVENPNDGSRTVLTDPANAAASPYGWHDTNGSPGAEYTDTRGNNVSVSVNGVYTSGGSSLNFDYPLDLTQAPSGYSSAAATNLFYLANMAHDIHYHYGFTEAAGNFQQMNYTGQGVGGDSVQAIAQDSSDIDNAYMSTPPDGQSPTLSMGIFDYTTPDRDADLESVISIHEYGHGVSNRLVGGPSNVNALDGYQSGGMGEGWSDWWGLMFTQKPTDTKLAAYPVGTYVIGQSPTGGGIRRYPYSVNMTTDPLTYGAYNSSQEVHDVGEIWCSTLWDLNWALIDKYGYSSNIMSGYTGAGSAGNILALQLVEDSLKLMPVRPTLLNSRNAILQADQALTGGANQALIWQVFARRGMGYSANDGGSDVATHVTEAFDVPAFQVVSQTPSSVATTPPASIDFQFSKNILQSSFSIADDVDSFTGPGGANLLSQITGYSFPSTNDLQLTFNPQTAQGAYTIVIGPNILAADGSGAMDQNVNGTPGEAGDAYSGTFRYDAHVMQVASTTPAVGGTLSITTGTVPLQITFDEPYSASSLGTSDLTLSQGSVASYVAIDSTTVEYELAGINHEGALMVTMAAGAVSDSYGNPGAAFSGTYQIDIGTASFPTPLTAVAPLGSLVYSGSVAGIVNSATDTDSYTIALDAGQTLTAVIVPAAALTPTLAISGPGLSVGPVAASATGKQVYLQTLTVATAGTYTVTVGSAAGTADSYTLQLTLNAAVETESHDGATNNDFATAQSLDSAFTSQGTVGQRVAVLGTTDSAMPTFISWSLDTNPGWTTQGQWAFGHPTGGGGASHGSPDPTSGHTGSNVFGVNLSGDYSTSVGGPYYLTTSAINCSGQSNVHLNFWRWLNTDYPSYATATVDVSNNGTTWTNIYTNPGTAVTDSSWQQMQYDIHAVADNQPTVYLRWGYSVGSGAWAYSGWNIDDVSLTAQATATGGDYYKLTLAAGESASVALSSLGTETPSVSLYDSSQQRLATGAASANATCVINNFVNNSGAAGVYYLQVVGSGVPYNLVVTKSADFDTELNNSFATAQPLVASSGNSAAALGYIEPGISGVEPDNYAAGTVLTSVVPGITLSVQGTTASVTSQTSSYTSTGTRVFGNGSSAYWTDTILLRADFSTPVSSVSLDLVPDDSYDPGFLKAYNASGVLLQDLETAAPTYPGFLTMTISRSTADIAYVVAGGQAGQVIYLDHLVVGGAGSGSDYYSVAASAGSTLTIATQTPGGGPNEFVNLLDPKVELYNPAGTLVASNDNGAADGRNALLNYTVTTSGNYRVRVLSTATQTGEYSLSVLGVTSAAAPFSVAGVSPTTGTRLNHRPGALTISLNDVALMTTVQSTDLLIDGGSTTASAVSMSDGKTLVFTLPTLSEGTHTFSIAAGTMTDVQGTPIQAFSSTLVIDLTGPRISATTLVENAIVPVGTLTYTAGFTEDMNTTLLSSADYSLVGLWSGSKTATATWLDSHRLQLQFSGLVDDAYTLTLFSGSGLLQDLAGNALDGEPHSPFSLPSGDGTPGGNFFIHFSADNAAPAFPTPLTAVSPLGSLVYTGSVQGAVSPASDTDGYTITLDAGQSLTAVVAPATTLTPTVRITGPGVSVGPTAASAAGKQVVVQTVTVATAGTYTITVASATGTSGAYSLQLYLNAAVEAESHDGSANNTRATAQNIDGSFLNLTTATSRASVLGTADASLAVLPQEVEPNNSIAQANSASANFAAYSGNLYHMGISGTISTSADQDWFKIGSLDAGDVLSVLQGAVGSSRGTLSDTYVYLYRYNSGSPVLVTSNDDGGPGMDSLIYRYSVTTADVYYVVAQSFANEYTGTYSLALLLENSGTTPLTGGTRTTETEPNDSVTTANDASTSWRAVQYLSHTTAAITSGDVDYYSYQFTAGDLVTVDIGATGTTTWRPRASLLNSAGTAIAVEDGTSSGPTADSWLYSFVIPTTGTYYVQAQSYSGTGTYNADVYLSTTTAPPVATPANDYYGLTLAAGDCVTLGLQLLATGTAHISLENSAGTTLASGVTGAGNLTEAVSRFSVATAGTYYAHVSSTLGAAPYNLVVTRNAAFDIEPNDTPATAEAIDGTSSIEGYASSSAATTLTMDEVAAQAVNNLSVKGVTFGFTVGGAASTDATYHDTLLGTTAYTQDPSISGNASGVLSWTFAQPAVTMQFGVALLSTTAAADGATVSLYSANGSLIGAYPVAVAANGHTYVSGLFSYSGPSLIASCSVSFKSTISSLFVVDNLVYTNNSSDWYSVTVPAASYAVRLATSTPAGGSGEFVNQLMPHLELYNSAGTTLLASGYVGSDGRNESLNYTTTAGGSYRIRVSGKNGTAGEYVVETRLSSPPTVAAATVNGIYGTGANVLVTVAFDRPVTVTGVPRLALNSGGTAYYTSGSGGSTLTFTYVVAAGQNTSHLDYASTAALTLFGGIIADSAGNAVNLNLPPPGTSGSLGASANIGIDTTAPTVLEYRVLFGSTSYNLVGSTRQNDLPWQISGIQAVFSEPIANGDKNSLSGLATTGFSGLGTNTLTWTMNSIGNGRFATALAGAGIDAITDAAGNPLFSGNGYAQSFNVLYGDATDDGYVSSADLLAVYRGMTQPYSMIDDLDGNGVVNMPDVQIVRVLNGASLPPAAQTQSMVATASHAANSLLFGGVSPQTNTCSLPAATQVNSVTFLPHAGTALVNGNAIELSGDIVDASTDGQTIELPLVLVGGSHTLNAAAGNLTIAGPIGESGGANSIVVTGPGTVTLSGTNSFAGGATVRLGKLRVMSAAALPDGSNLTVGGFTDLFSAPVVVTSESSMRASLVVSAKTADAASATTADTAALRVAAPTVAAASAMAGALRSAGLPEKPNSTTTADAALLQLDQRRTLDAALARWSADSRAWLAARADSAWSGDWGQKQDSSISALDAALAEYRV